MLWFKLKQWFEKNQSFCVQALFYTKSVLHKNCIHKNNVLAGPVQGLFAAYRIALSMVAGGTRRRRLNITNHPTHLEIYHPLVGGWEIRFLVGQVLGKHWIHGRFPTRFGHLCHLNSWVTCCTFHPAPLLL